MSSKEIGIQESTSSLSKVSSLDDDLDNIHLESGSSVKEMFDDKMDSNSWNEIESESDEEFMEDHGLVDDVTSASEDNTVHPIECYRCFITDEIIDLWFVKLTDMQNNTWKLMILADDPNIVNGCQSSMKKYSSSLVRSAMSRERFELLLKFLHFSSNNNKNSNQDRMFKLEPLSDLLKERFSSVYIYLVQSLVLTKVWYHGEEDFYSGNTYLEKRTSTV